MSDITQDIDQAKRDLDAAYQAVDNATPQYMDAAIWHLVSVQKRLNALCAEARDKRTVTEFVLPWMREGVTV